MSQSTTTDTSFFNLSSAATPSITYGGPPTDFAPSASLYIPLTTREPIPVNRTSTITVTSNTMFTTTTTPPSQPTNLGTSNAGHQFESLPGIPGLVILAWIGLVTYNAIYQRF